MSSLNDMNNKKNEPKGHFIRFDLPEEDNRPQKTREQLRKEAEETLAPYIRLAKRFGQNEDLFTWGKGVNRPALNQLREQAQEWIDKEICPTFAEDPDLLLLYEEFKHGIILDNLAIKCNDLLLEGKTGKEFLKGVYDHVLFWARFIWSMENYVREALIALDVSDIGEQEKVILRAFPERKKYQSINDLLKATINRQKSANIALQQPNAIVVPDLFRAVLTDNQYLNKLLHGEQIEKIEAKPTQKKDGTPLNGFQLMTRRDSVPFSSKDKLVLFAVLSIADRNKVIDNGKEVPAFTVSDVVAQLQPRKNKTTAYKKDSDLYKEVEASINLMRETKVAVLSKDFLNNRRGIELSENNVVAKEQPLIQAERALWTRRGKIVEGYLWEESDVISMLKKDFDWRFSISVARDIIPSNLNGDQLNLFAYVLERASYTLPNLNKVHIYGAGREDQKTLLKELGWLDVSLINRTLTPQERSKDQSQRKQIEKILKVLESSSYETSDLVDGKEEKNVVHFEVNRTLDAKKKLIGFTVKMVHDKKKTVEELPNVEM